MNRLFVAVATAAAACAAAVPAVLGLSGNPSFSEHIKVPVPSQASLVHYDDRGRVVAEKSTSASPARSAASGEAEPGDDRGHDVRSHEAEPGDDHGVDTTSSATSHEAEPGDDHGGRSTSPASTPAASTTSDGRGRHHGSDDTTSAAPSSTSSSEDTVHTGRGADGHGGDD